MIKKLTIDPKKKIQEIIDRILISMRERDSLVNDDTHCMFNDIEEKIKEVINQLPSISTANEQRPLELSLQKILNILMLSPRNLRSDQMDQLDDILYGELDFKPHPAFEP